MELETLHEVTTYFININKPEELTMSSWHNSMLAVRSEKGLHFYELAHNINCLDKKINCLQTFLPPAKSKASAKLFTDKVINNSMRNIDFTEMIHDQTLWPHNPQLTEEMTCVVYFEWSPVGLFANQESVLAVLNNIGGVDLFININSKWKHMLEVAGSFSDNFRKTLNEPRGFAELREAAHILSSTGLCWAPTLAGNNCCYIATAQKNNTIMFWLVLSNNSNVSVQFQGSIECGEGEILTMKWISISENNFVLVCSNILGQIILLDCQIKNCLVHLKELHLIWPDKDKMISTQLQYITINDKIILVCNKHRHLLILFLDKHYNVCGKNISNVSDHRITCVTNSRDEIYLSTINGKIFKINISTNNTILDVSLYPVECINIMNPTTELYDISFSQNGVLCTLITVDRRVNFRKEPLRINVVFATSNKILNSLVNFLIGNPTQELTNYWDVIELLRYKCMKHKEAPAIVYSELYEEACRNIYLLKLYQVFITFYINLKNQFKIDPIDNIPEESLETIKEEVLVIHAEMLYRKYDQKRLNEGLLEGLEMESFFGAMNFLEYYCKKNNRDLNDILSINSDLCDVVCEYTCQGCEEKIQGFSCKNNHLNMFCSLTFSPIETFEYLSCRWCNCTARIELASDNPKCLMCDVNLVIQ